MKRYYALIPLSNKGIDTPYLVEDQNERLLLCTWTENIFNEWVNTTNTFCQKPLKELVTGTKIYPPSEYDMYRSKPPKVLRYNCYPQAYRITETEAMERLYSLKKNIPELEEYVRYIENMKHLVKVSREEYVYRKKRELK